MANVSHRMMKIKTIQYYEGPLGKHNVGEVFERPMAEYEKFKRKAGHFEIVAVFEKPQAKIKPPDAGVPRLDLCQKVGQQVPDIDKRVVLWDGDVKVNYCGHVIAPGTEIIIPKAWLKTVMQMDGWFFKRGQVVRTSKE